jgi:AcrR family transcriptional regulator
VDQNAGAGGERKPRADAERNRTLLMEAAKSAFTEIGPEVSLDEIARRAGVGIGTLYRHFPTRDAIVQAVYQRQVQLLAAASGRLLENGAPMEALRAWMRLFVEYIATKQIISPALNALAGKSELFAASGALITGAMKLLVDRATAAGEIQPNVDPMDLIYALVGLSNVTSDSGWEDRAMRLIDVLIAGIRRDTKES